MEYNSGKMKNKGVIPLIDPRKPEEDKALTDKFEKMLNDPQDAT